MTLETLLKHLKSHLVSCLLVESLEFYHYRETSYVGCYGVTHVILDPYHHTYMTFA